MKKLGWTLVAACALLAISTSQAQERFKLISAGNSDELEQELNEAGAAGYRFAGSQGGESTFMWVDGAVVVMARDPAGRRSRYLVLATTRIGTMERELNEVPPEFDLVGMTGFFGEGVVILEAEDPGSLDSVP